MNSATHKDLERARNKLRKHDGTRHSGWLWRHGAGLNRKMRRAGMKEILDK